MKKTLINSCACYGSNDIHECYCNLKNNNMKNIHLIPTDKPSRLCINGKNQMHIYITSDEEIKLNDYITDGYKVWKWKDDSSLLGRQKVILTTDSQLIADEVQAIDDEFLEWFVKNPSCEWIEVIKIDVEQPKPLYPNGNHKGERVWIEQYKIIIPKEEPKQELERGITITHAGKQETLEDNKEKKYSEEDMREAMICVIVSNSIKNSKDISKYIASINQ